MNEGNGCSVGELFGDVPVDLAEELVETLAEGAGCRIERIVSCGQASPVGFWYDQEWDEWVVVLRGAGRLVFDGGGEPVEMSVGDWIHIPAHEKHRVEWTSPDEATVWLAVHFGGGSRGESPRPEEE